LVFALDGDGPVRRGGFIEDGVREHAIRLLQGEEGESGHEPARMHMPYAMA
jgi:hypothetical protein